MSREDTPTGGTAYLGDLAGQLQGDRIEVRRDGGQFKLISGKSADKLTPTLPHS